MSAPFVDDAQVRRRLSQSLRAIRCTRGLRPRQVAARMGMALRSYQHFEAGGGRLPLALLERFAEAVDCDPVALLLGAQFDMPDLAMLCLDNKLAATLLGELRDFAAYEGQAADGLEAAAALSAFHRTFGELARYSREQADRRRALGLPGIAHRIVPQLTGRQLECLRWTQAGKSSADIGAILGISARTADDHLAAACRRLGVRTRVQAIATAQALGILRPYP